MVHYVAIILCSKKLVFFRYSNGLTVLFAPSYFIFILIGNARVFFIYSNELLMRAFPKFLNLGNGKANNFSAFLN